MASYECAKCPGYCCSYPLIQLTKRDVERLGKHFGLSFKEAKAMANALRKDLVPDRGIQVKMIFADNELAAEDTLSQPRELDPTLAGDDY